MYYTVNGFALCPQPRLYILILWNSFFSISECWFFLLLGQRLFQRALVAVFKMCCLCPKLSRVSKLYLSAFITERSSLEFCTRRFTAVLISSRNTRFLSSRFQKETFGGFSIQSVNRHQIVPWDLCRARKLICSQSAETQLETLKCVHFLDKNNPRRIATLSA